MVPLPHAIPLMMFWTARHETAYVNRTKMLKVVLKTD